MFSNSVLVLIKSVDKILLIILVIGMEVGLLLYSRRTIGAKRLLVFASSLLCWSLVGIFIHEGILQPGRLSISLTYLFEAMAVFSLLSLSLQFSRLRADSVRRKQLWPLLIQPVIMQIMIWRLPDTVKFYDSPSITGSEFPASFIGMNWVNHIYLIALNLAALLLLAQSISLYAPTNVRLFKGIFLGFCIPLLPEHLGITGSIGTSSVALIGYIAAEFVIFFSLVNAGFPKSLASNLRTAMDKNGDGWLMLDRDEVVVDANLQIESYLGMSRTELVGKHAAGLFEASPNLLSHIGERFETELNSSIILNEKSIYANIRVIPTFDEQKEYTGQLIIWRNTTEQRLAAKSRQHARDEMFNLLSSITNAASESASLEDFFDIAVYQLVYTFRGDSCVAFLLDDTVPFNKPRLILASEYGIPGEFASHVEIINASDPWLTRLFQTKDYFLINDVKADTLMPPSMKSLLRGSLLIIPMIADDQSIGFIALGKNDTTFDEDVIARATIAVEQISRLVYNDRRKQEILAMTERKRLVRDMHDSLSQKLYGIVTLTEVFRAGADAGKFQVPIDLVYQLGESARESLKELRLFLYELQPINFDKEDLTALLSQRLAAVEGRSNVRTSLKTDEISSINKDKKVALYYIAQEALNNILKHAGASTVTVRLKQSPAYVKLEISDDGCGFEPKSARKGGIGLRNMRERAAQVNGKYRIKSSPGHGTHISVWVRRDDYHINEIH